MTPIIPSLLQNSFLVDAEHCRSELRHRARLPDRRRLLGSQERPTPDLAPNVAGVHYRDKRDAAEDEVTVQKRHLSELGRRHAVDGVFGHMREHCWSAMQKLMSETYGTYPEDLERLRHMVKEIAAAATFKSNVENFGRVLEHMLFDRIYFEAVLTNGFESSSDFPALISAGLTDVARKQWVSDFEVLVAYAHKQESTLISRKKGKAKKKVQRPGAFVDSALTPPKAVPTECYEAPKAPHPLHKANHELYVANKKLASENASLEAKLQWMKATLSAVASKIATKLEATQGPGDLAQRLSSTVSALLQHSSTENTPPDDAVHPEIGMLTEQLKKLDQSNGRLQDELVELRQQLVAARQKKKGA
ncbi:hypothetical protein AAVH_28106 [Aphelenchoides avenae]|nr:hypothetical protein AAVH_28106 [Aphelenchus avenae]